LEVVAVVSDLSELGGYISDLGNCGATRSSLGMDKNLVVQKVAQGMELNLEPPEHPEGVMVNGIVARINAQTHRCESIVRIDRRRELNYTEVR
jgi:calcineurin-like phosphoesterase